MAKYARPRPLSGSRPRKLGLLYRSKTSGGHISPYSVYNLYRYRSLLKAAQYFPTCQASLISACSSSYIIACTLGAYMGEGKSG